jgi:hypothetical protein
MPWLTIIKFGLPCLIAAAIVFGSAWEIQGIRIGKLDNNVSELIGITHKWDAAYKSCEKANTTNVAAITELQSDVKKANAGCDKQQGIQDRTLLRLSQIDALHPYLTRGKNEKDNPVVGNSDPILAALDGLFSATGEASGSDSGKGIHQTGDSAVAGAAAGIPGAIPNNARLYCLDEVNAKNLMKNLAQERGRTQRIETIIEGLRR